MCLTAAMEKHSTQSSFACVVVSPEEQCCVPTLCGWASGVAESPVAHGQSPAVSAPALAALLHLWGTAGLCWPCPFRHNFTAVLGGLSCSLSACKLPRLS